MANFLDEIMTLRRQAVADLKRAGDREDAARAAPPVRDFRAALAAGGMSLIAEIKRRSPSRGDLNPGLDPAALAQSYEAGGARCVSVLTEPAFFNGSPQDLTAARAAVAIPVLWKDFVIDPCQIVEARARGADAVLLIVRILGDDLAALVAEAKRWELTALVEIFDEADLERAVAAGADVIGVNHRDLETFDEDPGATARLRPQFPDGVIAVGESAISTRADVQALDDIGVHAVLVGEAIVTHADPAAKIRELLGT